MIAWTADDAFEVAGTQYVCDPFGVRIAHEPERFCLAKVRRIVERYEELLRSLAPKTIVEVGILEGASTALFADLARPDTLVALEREAAPTEKLQRFISNRGLGKTVRVFGGVDQADTERVTSIVEAELGDRALDLVVDDASHLLEPTRATFSCLFGRLRPGGIYLIEDWAAGLNAAGPTSALGATEGPLVDLVFEIIAAKGRRPGLCGDVIVRGGWTMIERGPEPIDAAFDIRVASTG